jgi:hypothetical protein
VTVRAAVAALVLAWTVAASVEAQTVAAPAVKAAFFYNFYNFAKFAEWPADVLAPGAPLSLCVFGDAAVATALAQTLNGQAIEGHKLMAHGVTADSPIRSCHLLYVGGVDSKPFAQLLESVRDTPVFTVGDGEKFAERGGVAQLVLDNDRMCFAINISAAHRARLTLSSRLLSLAIIVKDTR